VDGSFCFWHAIAPDFMQSSLKRRSDKGKPAERRGRKATGLKSSLFSSCFRVAGLPKTEPFFKFRRAPRDESPQTASKRVWVQRLQLCTQYRTQAQNSFGNRIVRGDDSVFYFLRVKRWMLKELAKFSLWFWAL
jgi:hypothetical protein